MTRSSSDESIGEALGETRWDHVPDRSGGALLKPMQRYFRGFPWAGRDGAAVGGAQAQPSTVAPVPEDEDIENADFDVD